jgi:hypothetical protein
MAVHIKVKGKKISIAPAIVSIISFVSEWNNIWNLAADQKETSGTKTIQIESEINVEQACLL